MPGGDHGTATPLCTDLGQMGVIRIFCHVDSGRKEEASGSEKENGGSEVTSGELVISLSLESNSRYLVFEFKKGSEVDGSTLHTRGKMS